VGPRILDMRGDQPDPALLSEVSEHLVRGGLVAMPTETVYGFGCVPDEAPMSELQRLKSRGPEKPFLLLIPRIDSVPDLGWGPEALELAKVFWPGALTLILTDTTRSFPLGVRSTEGGVAVRVSPHPLARAVLSAVNRPLVSTSANLPGGPSALGAAEALDTARALGAGDRLWVLDGGFLEPSDPSTIIDCTGPMPRVMRSGAIPFQRVRCVLPEIHDAT
jgi:L-threonylcarbamoyladenylate synthase